MPITDYYEKETRYLCINEESYSFITDDLELASQCELTTRIPYKVLPFMVADPYKQLP